MAYTSPYSKGRVRYPKTITNIGVSGPRTAQGTSAIPMELMPGYQQLMGGTPSGTPSVFSNYMNPPSVGQAAYYGSGGRTAPTATGPSTATQVGGIQSQAILEQQRRVEELRNMILKRKKNRSLTDKI